MIKINEIENSITGFDALYEKAGVCIQGVRYNKTAANFYIHRFKETFKLWQEFRMGKYKPRRTHLVEITHPKHRVAVAISFRDRVYQRSLNDNQIYPQMTKSFIYANLACQNGKGTDAARRLMDKYLHREFINHGTNFKILQCDCEHYYDNLSHKAVKAAFREKLDDISYQHAKTILDGQYQGEVGYNPGSQIVQIAGISMLDGLDHFIKEVLHIKSYVRVMDDFILIHPDEQYLLYCRECIESYLNFIGLKLHPKKTGIRTPTKGFRFLGFDYHMTNTGKIIMTIDPENVRFARKRLYRAAQLVKKGQMEKTKFDEMYRDWKAHASKGNSTKLLRRMDEYTKSLFKEE